MDRRALVLVLVAATAHADKKLQQMTPGFAREAQTCATQISGLKKVQTGGATLAPTLSADDKAALDNDLATLAAGLAGVEAYCTAVTELVAFLETNKAASYKSVERELDTRDNAVRKLRKASKATIDALAPITRKWIGRMAQMQTTKPAPPEKAKPVKFPSGRTVELPAALAGAWKAGGSASSDTLDYTDKNWSATVFVRSFSGATCEQQEKTRAPRRIDGGLTKTDGVDIAWHGVVASGAAKTYDEVLCARGTDGGGWIGTITVRPAANDKVADLRALAVRLIAAQQAAPKAP